MNALAPWRRRLGRLVLRFWHQPTGKIRDSLRNGGPWVERATARERDRMEGAARSLPPLPVGAGFPVTLHFLSGRRFWYQTAVGLHSFARASGRPVRAEIYDDGSFDGESRASLQRLGPQVIFHDPGEIGARLDRYLPEKSFPVLRERWRNYPNIRKLTDPHLGSSGWKLVIDSDLLFFRRPDFLLNWTDAPDRPLHALDCEQSYGYPTALLSRLCGATLANRVNVGLCGLRSDALDWAELESWCAELCVKRKPSYYLEQALVAMLSARQPCAVAPGPDYLTKPSRAEVQAPRAVMHHYVADSKRWYFRYGWPHCR
jgi:hypothetical protein